MPFIVGWQRAGALATVLGLLAVFGVNGAMAGSPRPARSLKPRITYDAPVAPVNLRSGQRQSITLPKEMIKRAESGDKRIALVIMGAKLAKTIQIEGRVAGVTNVVVWSATGRVRTYVVTVR